MDNFGITLIDGELETGTEKHTNTDFGLIMTNHVIPKPNVIPHKITIPYMSGNIDLTDAVGSPTYSERTGLVFEFEVKDGGRARCERIATDLAAFIHGKKLLMITDAEPEFFYVVRLEFDYSKSALNWSHITLKGTAEPFKYCVRLGGDDWLWDTFDFENGVITELNDLTPSASTGYIDVPISTDTIGTVPEFDVTVSSGESGLSVAFGGRTHNMATTGTYYFPQIRIDSTVTSIRVSGAGTFSIVFRGKYI